MIKTNETWKPVTGFEGLYEVSNHGNIRSCDRFVSGKNNSKVRLRGKPLKQRNSRKGYKAITLHKEGAYYSMFVHRIVADAFIDNPDMLPQVNHKDANKSNNHVDNLEWITQLDNMRHASANGCFGKFSEKQLDAVKNNLKFCKESRVRSVVQYLDDGTEIAIYRSIADAERITGVYSSKITSCCKGKRNKSGGYRWRYLEGE